MTCQKPVKWSLRTLAEKYAVSYGTILRIIRFKRCETLTDLEQMEIRRLYASK